MAGNVRARVAVVCVMAGIVLLGLAALGPAATAVNNPLAGWTMQGGSAAWQVKPAGDSVYVNAPASDFPHSNGSPSMFVSPANVGGTFKVSITPNNEADDDYVGFALGYSAPINDSTCQTTTSCPTNFYLFDWKKAQEMENGTATTDGHEGFSLMRVQSQHDMSNNNTPDHINCFWTHQTVAGACAVLGTDYGTGKGYAFGITYTFQVTYTSSQIKIVMLGTGGNPDTTIFDVVPGSAFQTGRLAFYNYSQPNVEYAFDDGTITTTTTTTSTTLATTSTTAATNTTTKPTVGPAVSSSIVRTGPNSVATTVELTLGALLILAGAAMTAARGKRPDGRFYA